MGFYFILASTLLYCGATISFLASRQFSLAIVYFGYSFANIGFLALAYKAE